MYALNKNVTYFDSFGVEHDIINDYNNTHHKTIKMKPVEVKDNTYINSIKEVNDKYPKFKVGGHVSISKYKNTFAKGYSSTWSEDVFWLKKFHVPWTYVINDLSSE